MLKTTAVKKTINPILVLTKMISPVTIEDENDLRI